jgi:hypothetical protein
MSIVAGRARAMMPCMSKTRGVESRSGNRAAARRLFESERLFQDFRELTPYCFRPLARCFPSFDAYERWRRAQTNPWYR